MRVWTGPYPFLMHCDPKSQPGTGWVADAVRIERTWR
jgi:hypothetical protein